MTWTDQAWTAATSIFEAIVAHPFIIALTDGTLDREKFLFYIAQDSLYLDDFGKILAALAIKNQNRAEVEDLLKFAAETIQVEKELHRTFGVAEAAAPTPSNLLYTSYLHRLLAASSLETALAGTLPCFWIYQKVGERLQARSRPGNPYQSWIDAYGGEEYARSVRTARAMADRLAAAVGEAGRDAMTAAFVLASKMEWMFWDAAWRLETWPV
ncbi:MAG: TenA family protein [Deltaproteobacteria bacterium]|jgi:thiaminase/transcriptional activator TenA|nr:TenA family protein [Deltaproteobacteria bacterium]